jgi:hypothetical protein
MNATSIEPQRRVGHTAGAGCLALVDVSFAYEAARTVTALDQRSIASR